MKSVAYGRHTMRSKPTRPLVFCDPENGWNEIVTAQDLECEGDSSAALGDVSAQGDLLGRRDEGRPGHHARFYVPHVYTETDWGMHETRHGGQDGGSYVWDAPLSDYAMLDRLSFPQIEVDAEATDTRGGRWQRMCWATCSTCGCARCGGGRWD